MQKKIRVLHINVSSNPGGIENLVRNWVHDLPEDITFDFVNVCKEPIAYSQELKAKGCKIFPVVPRKKNPLRSYVQLKKFIEQGEYDFVHYHAMSLSWVEPITITNKLGNKKAIIHSHTVINKQVMKKKDYVMHVWGRRRLQKQSFLKLACGKEAGRSMFGTMDFTVMENGFSLEQCRYSDDKRKRIRKQYGLTTEILIGHVGRSGIEKNYSFLLQVFKQLSDDDSNVKLMLIGDILQDASIQNRIDSYGIRDKVICTGRITDIKAYYSAMDVFFFPSLWEGFSVSLLEAQAAGLPCVVSDHIARESDVSGRVTFVGIDDSKKVTEVLKTYLHCTKNRECMSIDSRYDVKNASQKMFDYYRNHL